MRPEMLMQLKQLKIDLKRGGRLALISLIVAIAWVPAIAALARPVAPGDLAAVAAIPLIVSYVFVRLIALFVAPEEMTREQHREMERNDSATSTSDKVGMVFTIGLFVLGLWTIAVASISYVAYAGLGITWAVQGATTTIRVAAGTVAFMSILICLANLGREWMIKIARFAHNVINRPIGHQY